MRREISQLIKALKKKRLRLSLAESITCGLAAHQLTIIPGTTDVFDGGIICYSVSAKEMILGVPKSLVAKHTAESQQVTDAMANGLKKHFQTGVYAAVTGLASAGGSESKSKPVGTVFFTVIHDGKYYRSKKHFSGTPLQIKRKVCKELYSFILSSL